MIPPQVSYLSGDHIGDFRMVQEGETKGRNAGNGLGTNTAVPGHGGTFQK